VRQGPPMARVTEVRTARNDDAAVVAVEPEDNTFEIRPTQ
jgi:hypothetical protein